MAFTKLVIKGILCVVIIVTLILAKQNYYINNLLLFKLHYAYFKANSI